MVETCGSSFRTELRTYTDDQPRAGGQPDRRADHVGPPSPACGKGSRVFIDITAAVGRTYYFAVDGFGVDG